MSKHGFVYIWRDSKRNKYYVGCHWGKEDDGYVCSSNWMRSAYKHRPQDFKRKILATGLDRKAMYVEESRWLSMIKSDELKVRYYNLHNSCQNLWHSDPNYGKTIGQKISASKMGKSPKWVDPILRGQRISEGKKKAFALNPRPKKERIKKGPRIIERHIVLCKVCGIDTQDPRKNFCSKEHRYQAMNETRSSKIGSRWCNQ